jgi:hypothetical protein
MGKRLEKCLLCGKEINHEGFCCEECYNQYHGQYDEEYPQG